MNGESTQPAKSSNFSLVTRFPSSPSAFNTQLAYTMTSPRGFEPCCLKSFDWNGTPSGHEATIANNPTYVTGSNPNAAVLIAHDALGWRFGNTRLLADHFAKEVRPGSSQK